MNRSTIMIGAIVLRHALATSGGSEWEDIGLMAALAHTLSCAKAIFLTPSCTTVNLLGRASPPCRYVPCLAAISRRTRARIDDHTRAAFSVATVIAFTAHAAPGTGKVGSLLAASLVISILLAGLFMLLAFIEITTHDDAK